MSDGVFHGTLKKSGSPKSKAPQENSIRDLSFSHLQHCVRVILSSDQTTCEMSRAYFIVKAPRVPGLVL